MKKLIITLILYTLSFQFVSACSMIIPEFTLKNGIKSILMPEFKTRFYETDNIVIGKISNIEKADVIKGKMNKISKRYNMTFDILNNIKGNIHDDKLIVNISGVKWSSCYSNYDPNFLIGANEGKIALLYLNDSKTGVYRHLNGSYFPYSQFSGLLKMYIINYLYLLEFIVLSILIYILHKKYKNTKLLITFCILLLSIMLYTFILFKITNL